MNPQEETLPVNRNYIFAAGCFTIIFSIIVIYFVLSTQTKVEPEQISQARISEEQTIPASDISKYSQDSDMDLIPNYIEDELVLNKYISEVNYCRQKLPVCSKSPIENTSYLTILMDASTSMEVPIESGKTKLDLIRNQVLEFTEKNFKNKYLDFSVMSFGNRGDKNYIAGNESCVATVNFKPFGISNTDKNYLNQFKTEIESKYVPNGKSAIVFSIEKAEKSFPNPKANNHVIVITDKTDECTGDLKTNISNILGRKTIKRIDFITINANQDAISILKDAVESNGGKFTNSNKEISNTMSIYSSDFIYNKWCKVSGTSEIYKCIDQNYEKAVSFLNKNLTPQTNKNETDKIREILSSINYLIENFRQTTNQELKSEYDKYIENYGKTY